jgi:hypothetical protein
MCSKQEPQHSQTQRKLTRLLPWLLIAIVIIVTAVFRTRLLGVPLERDEGEYAYAGQLMLQGIPPYQLAYNMKMPGIYAAYALILAVFGQTPAGIHLGLLVVNAVTIIVIFLFAKYLTDPLTASFAAAAFAVMSLAPAVLGIFANAEHFVLLFAVPGLLLLLYAVDRDNLLLLLASALLLGLAFLMKQHGAAFILFAGLYLLFWQLRQKPIVVKRLLATIFLFAAGAVAPYALTCLILWHAGVFDRFWFWTFTYARQYASIIPLNEGLAALKAEMTNIAGSAILLWILAALGLLALVFNKRITRRRPFIIAFLLFSFLAVCPALHFREHYFILLLPAVALLSALGLSPIRQLARRPPHASGKQLFVAFLALAALIFSLWQQRQCLFATNLEALSRSIYRLNPFPESLDIGRYIKAHSAPNDTVAVLGSEPQIYFYAHRHSATAYIYVYPLMEPQPYALEMQKEMIKQIETAQPKFLVFINMDVSWRMDPASSKMIFDWFAGYYPQRYKLVGIIDYLSPDNVVSRWDRDAAEYHSDFPCGVSLFERLK